MLSGEYEHRLDQKGRVAIPVKLRKEFPNGLVITRGFDQCIVAYAPEEWQKVSDKLSSLPTTLDKNRRLIRHVIGGAFDIELDGQGRIALPATLRQYAQIKDTVIMSGNRICLEIWSKEVWERDQMLTPEQAHQLAETMELR
ncbi:MAG: division/cell wall cluster transcriptional repressor MraZ [Dehalococcoidia bacterium]|nr:division/cell wall cluster transcriptional repressor MraZ [Dehalococcoidia bacterium]